MNTFQLSCFLAVADTLSFARAAERLNITQPAVTHQIRSLETELGAKCCIGIGTPACHLRELADRYKEAQTAIDVGKVFDVEKAVIN